MKDLVTRRQLSYIDMSAVEAVIVGGNEYRSTTFQGYDEEITLSAEEFGLEAVSIFFKSGNTLTTLMTRKDMVNRGLLPVEEA